MSSGRAEVAQDRDGLFGAAARVRRNACVEGLPLTDGGVERAERLLHRSVWIEAVVVEDVDVVQTQTRQTLVEAGEQVLARASVAVRAGPHVPTSFARDDEFVAVGLEVLGEQPAEVRLGGSVRRPVVVREVEVGDPQIERPAQDLALGFGRLVVTEVVPQPERYRW